MPIDYSSLRGLTARRLVTALQRDGFTLARRKGATRFFKHPDNRRVTIENEARWTEEDLRRLRLIS